MYHSEWLTRFFGRHPWAGFATILTALALCVYVLLSAGDERAPISRLPMWMIAGFGIPLFAWVGIRYVKLLRSKRNQ